jgi:hypothetical protein
MYSVVRIVEGAGHPASDGPEVAAAANLLGSAGLVTLLAVGGDDGTLVTIEIFETLDDLRTALAEAHRGSPRWPSGDRPGSVRTIVGEIVFQRGL